MKTTVLECDCCRKVSHQCVTVTLDTNKEPDPSGNGYITVATRCDLCRDCVETILLELWNSNQRWEYMKNIRTRKE